MAAAVASPWGFLGLVLAVAVGGVRSPSSVPPAAAILVALVIAGSLGTLVLVAAGRVPRRRAVRRRRRPAGAMAAAAGADPLPEPHRRRAREPAPGPPPAAEPARGVSWVSRSSRWARFGGSTRRCSVFAGHPCSRSPRRRCPRRRLEIPGGRSTHPLGRGRRVGLLRGRSRRTPSRSAAGQAALARAAARPARRRAGGRGGRARPVAGAAGRRVRDRAPPDRAGPARRGAAAPGRAHDDARAGAELRGAPGRRRPRTSCATRTSRPSAPWRSCASTVRGVHPRVLSTTAWRRRSTRSPTARRCRSRRHRAAPPAAGAVEVARTSWSARRSPTWPGTRGDARHGARPPRDDRLVITVRDDGGAAPIRRRGPGSPGWPTGWRSPAAGCGCPARPAGRRCCAWSARAGRSSPRTRCCCARASSGSSSGSATR